MKNLSFDNPNKFIDKIVEAWLTNMASDIHISPWNDIVTIKYRINWELNSAYSFSSELYWKFTNAMKIRTWMDISEHNHIQDWTMFIKIHDDIWGQKIWVNLRVSFLPMLYWENIVMRLLLSESKYLEIDSLWFSEKNTKLLKEVWHLSEWLILVCWWTWSWKTTTLYSLLNTYDKTKKSIFTLEDPIEYQVDWYVQSQIRNIRWEGKKDLSYTFWEWLIWILRQDPDIIMIWELRRKEEANTCLEAANTWHIVLWTIHSNNSVSVITRLRQFWIESYLIASWLKYIASQKIVKWLCFNCKIKKTLNKNDFSEKIQKFLKEENIDVYAHNLDWCDSCNEGYKGVKLLWEIIKVDDNIYNLLVNNAPETDIKDYLYKNWFIPFYIDGLFKSKEGLVDINDIIDLEY